MLFWLAFVNLIFGPSMRDPLNSLHSVVAEFLL